MNPNLATSLERLTSLPKHASLLSLELSFCDDPLVHGFLEIHQFLSTCGLQMVFVFANRPGTTGKQAGDKAENYQKSSQMRSISFHKAVPSIIRHEVLGTRTKKRKAGDQTKTLDDLARL